MQKSEYGMLSNIDLCGIPRTHSQPFELTGYKGSPFNQNFMVKRNARGKIVGMFFILISKNTKKYQNSRNE